MKSHQLEHSEEIITNMHDKEKCEGQNCCIHNMSNHHMRNFPQHWRDDWKLMERICSHGVGHPDPDDPNEDRIHGCDGCCVE